MTDLDQLTRDLTAFDSFTALLDTDPRYRPTLMPRDFRHVALANAYDEAMTARGDQRRAWRGTRWPLPDPILSVRLMGVPNGSGRESEWLKVIWAINAEAATLHGYAKSGDDPDLPIGSPLYSHEWWTGPEAWCEEYRDYRVILIDERTNYIQARTDEAAEALRRAVQNVTGMPFDEHAVLEDLPL